jgi:phospholipid/cholesterol/gamma-HCH transport system ATP-binding protein
MHEPLIQIQNLTKAFGDRVILDQASLDIHRHKITAIIGKSGVGKSVLVKHIIGLIQPDSGDIIFDGKAYSQITAREFSAIKDRCSYMFQHNALFDSLTVFENIALPLREKYRLPKKEIIDRVQTRIEQLELDEVAHLYPKNISGGMQKRVALARALITNPEIIFFDEPTTGLDPIRKKTVFSMIHRYHEKFNFTAVIITHDIPDIFYIAHTVNIIDHGKIIFSGSPVALDQSDNPELFVYTHGHEMLVDDLTKLLNRIALRQKITTWSTEKSTPMHMVSVEMKGLRKLVDFKGHLLGHVFIKNFAKFLQDKLSADVCAGLFSQEVLVLVARNQDKEWITTTQEQLTDFFTTPGIQQFCQANHLCIQIRGLVGSENTDPLLALKQRLTSRQCV